MKGIHHNFDGTNRVSQIVTECVTNRVKVSCTTTNREIVGVVMRNALSVKMYIDRFSKFPSKCKLMDYQSLTNCAQTWICQNWSVRNFDSSSIEMGVGRVRGGYSYTRTHTHFQKSSPYPYPYPSGFQNLSPYPYSSGISGIRVLFGYI